MRMLSVDPGQAAAGPVRPLARPRAGRTRRAGHLLPALVATLIGGCSAVTGDEAPDVGPAPGTPLFTAPAPQADCSRIDLATLRVLTTSDPPQPRRILTYADPSRPAQTWAGCVGRIESAASPTPAGGPPPATPSAAGGGTAGTRAVPEGTTGAVAWLVRYATSAAAERPQPLSAGASDSADVRTLVRSTTLGDAEVRVELGVHADDHQTLVLVTVFNPRTGRNAAECGLRDVAGDGAEDAVSWCLRSLAGQLVGRPGRVVEAASAAQVTSSATPAR